MLFPVGMRYDDLLDLVRYMTTEDEGANIDIAQPKPPHDQASAITMQDRQGTTLHVAGETLPSIDSNSALLFLRNHIQPHVSDATQFRIRGSETISTLPFDKATSRDLRIIRRGVGYYDVPFVRLESEESVTMWTETDASTDDFCFAKALGFLFDRPSADGVQAPTQIKVCTRLDSVSRNYRYDRSSQGIKISNPLRKAFADLTRASGQTQDGKPAMVVVEVDEKVQKEYDKDFDSEFESAYLSEVGETGASGEVNIETDAGAPARTGIRFFAYPRQSMPPPPSSTCKVCDKVIPSGPAVKRQHYEGHRQDYQHFKDIARENSLLRESELKLHAKSERLQTDNERLRTQRNIWRGKAIERTRERNDATTELANERSEKAREREDATNPTARLTGPLATPAQPAAEDSTQPPAAAQDELQPPQSDHGTADAANPEPAEDADKLAHCDFCLSNIQRFSAQVTQATPPTTDGLIANISQVRDAHAAKHNATILFLTQQEAKDLRAERKEGGQSKKAQPQETPTEEDPATASSAKACTPACAREWRDKAKAWR